MSIDYETAHTIASIAFESYALPDGFTVDDTEGFSGTDGQPSYEFTKKFYYLNDDDALEVNGPTSTAYFNIKISAESAVIEDVYVITSNGGNIIGELPDEALPEIYEAAKVEMPSTGPKL